MDTTHTRTWGGFLMVSLHGLICYAHRHLHVGHGISFSQTNTLVYAFSSTIVVQWQFSVQWLFLVS